MSYKGKYKAYYGDSDDWSDWGWDPNIGQYYRTRINSEVEGGYDYDYAPPQTSEVPRSEAGNAAVTTNSYLTNAASANTSYSEHDGYKYELGQKDTDSGNTSSTQHGTSGYSGIEQPDEKAPYGTNTYRISRLPIPEIGQDRLDKLSENVQKMAISPRSTTSQFGSRSTSAISGSAATSSSVYDSPDYRISAGASRNLKVPDKTRHIVGTKGKSEPLDPKFRVHHSRFFIPGQVFKILWCEPEGETKSNNTVITDFEFAEEGKHGQKVYHSIRRFIIVATSPRGSSCCVPILTYQHQGTTKKGLNRFDHAIVYTSDTPPTELQGEEKLYRDPIKVVPKTPRDKLDPASRINYAKIYTVEHNVKVHFIGSLSPNSERKFMAAFDDTWANMTKMGG